MDLTYQLYEGCSKVLNGALLVVTSIVMCSKIYLYMQLENQSKYFGTELKT